jgi:hypothetical protein
MDDITNDPTLTTEDLTPLSIFGKAHDFSLTDGGKPYTTADGMTGQRIGRAYVPLRYPDHNLASGFSIPFSINRLVSADGSAYVTVSLPTIWGSMTGKGGKSGIHASPELTKALRDKLSGEAAVWYRSLGSVVQAAPPTAKFERSAPVKL